MSNDWPRLTGRPTARRTSNAFNLWLCVHHAIGFVRAETVDPASGQCLECGCLEGRGDWVRSRRKVHEACRPRSTHGVIGPSFPSIERPPRWPRSGTTRTRDEGGARMGRRSASFARFPTCRSWRPPRDPLDGLASIVRTLPLTQNSSLLYSVCRRASARTPTSWIIRRMIGDRERPPGLPRANVKGRPCPPRAPVFRKPSLDPSLAFVAIVGIDTAW